MCINLHLVCRLWITPVSTVMKVVPRSAFLPDTNCCSFVCTHPNAAHGTTTVPAVTPKLRARIGNVHCGILVLCVEGKRFFATCSLRCSLFVTISNPTVHKNDNKASVSIFVAISAFNFPELQYFPGLII